MRLSAILVVLVVSLGSVVLADAKGTEEISLPAISVAEALPPVPGAGLGLDFGGQLINNQLVSSRGLSFGVDDVYRPLVYDFVMAMGGTPTREPSQAPIVGEWSFCVMSPRETYASGTLGNWGRRIGGRIENEKLLVRASVTFFENVSCGSSSHPRPGRLVAGPFTGVGNASATTSWQAFLSSCSWARGLDLRFGQEEWGHDKLKFKALVESVKNLKPTTFASLPSPY